LNENKEEDLEDVSGSFHREKGRRKVCVDEAKSCIQRIMASMRRRN